MIYDQLRTFLQKYKKKTVDLVDLQQLMPGNITYQQFAETILLLEADGVLIRIKSSKNNNKMISLANKYSITHQALNQQYIKRLHQIQLELDPQISLEYYFHQNDPQLFERDSQSIKSIDTVLKSKGLPQEGLTLPKLSYDLVQDEKWLQEKGGIALLKRIKLWTSLQTKLRFEPIVFSIDPDKLNKQVQCHLILENKTTFMDLMEGLHGSVFTSLIYGAGWQIISSIQQFKHQIGTTCEDHFYYFGDLDHEGLHIWYSLNELIQVSLATPFYQALLMKEPSIGKGNQKRHELSVETFLTQFEDASKKRMEKIFSTQGYYPQESLNKDELGEIIHRFSRTPNQILEHKEDTK